MKPEHPSPRRARTHFTGLSPTTAEHVLKALGSEVDLILDGGPTSVGIESTVLSLAGQRPVLLRPGTVTQRQLEDVIGEIEVGETTPEGAHASPGLHAKHYSPLTPLFLLPSGAALPQRGRGAYLWLNEVRPASQTQQMPVDAAQYAAILYETLPNSTSAASTGSLSSSRAEWPEWAGVIDRLRRASS